MFVSTNNIWFIDCKTKEISFNVIEAYSGFTRPHSVKIKTKGTSFNLLVTYHDSKNNLSLNTSVVLTHIDNTYFFHRPVCFERSGSNPRERSILFLSHPSIKIDHVLHIPGGVHFVDCYLVDCSSLTWHKLYITRSRAPRSREWSVSYSLIRTKNHTWVTNVIASKQIWNLHSATFCNHAKHTFLYNNLEPNELEDNKYAEHFQLKICSTILIETKGNFVLKYSLCPKNQNCGTTPPIPPGTPNWMTYYLIILTNEFLHGITERNVCTKLEENRTNITI